MDSTTLQAAASPRLEAVVQTYNVGKSLGLAEAQLADLVQHLKSLRTGEPAPVAHLVRTTGKGST